MSTAASEGLTAVNGEWLLRPAVTADVPAMMKIKNHAIRHTTTVYDTEEKDLAWYENWLFRHETENWPVYVICPAEKPEVAAGYATYGSFRPHPAYGLTVENSIYVSPDFRRRGLGTMLLEKLLAAAAGQGFHLMIAAIDSENLHSCHMHAKLGFTEAGRIHEAGRKFDRWLDVVFYEKILETERRES